MKVATAAEMRLIDAKATEEFGIPAMVLMERAGLAVADRVQDLFGKKKVIVLSGGGNNGGDGIVAARTLLNRNWNVRVLLMAGEDSLSPACLAQYRIARQMDVPIEFRTTVEPADIHGALVIDALLGTGLNKPVTSPMTGVMAFLNRSSVPVLAVDIPSGISSDTGQVMGEAVRADSTVTFGLPKVGHFLHPGAEFTGRLFVEDIGFPDALLRDESLRNQTVERALARSLVPERWRHSHKGTYGHVLIVAGSRGRSGAAIMAARACMRTGAGLVTIGVPEGLVDVFQQRVTEEMVLPLPDAGNGTISGKAFPVIREFLDEHADVLAIGPGLTAGSQVTAVVKKLLPTATAPAVLDADAINALSGQREILKKVKSPLVLTPHSGEMARLLGAARPGRTGRSRPVDATMRAKIDADRIGTTASFCAESGVCLVLKGAPTVIGSPDGSVFINTTGNPGMATAGAGDVLTGMISALLGQGLAPEGAAVLGTYLHGLAGDLAASEKGTHALIASDIISMIPAAFVSLGVYEGPIA